MKSAHRAAFVSALGLGLASCGGPEQAALTGRAVTVQGSGVQAAFVQDADGTVRAFLEPALVQEIDAGLVDKQSGLPLNPSDGLDVGGGEDLGFRVRSGSSSFSGSTGASTRFSGSTGPSTGFDGRTTRSTSFEASLRSPGVTPSCDLSVICGFLSGADARECRANIRSAQVPVRLDAYLCAFVDFFRCAVSLQGAPTFADGVCLPELQRVINEGVRAGLFEPGAFR